MGLLVVSLEWCRLIAKHVAPFEHVSPHLKRCRLISKHVALFDDMSPSSTKHVALLDDMSPSSTTCRPPRQHVALLDDMSARQKKHVASFQNMSPSSKKKWWKKIRCRLISKHVASIYNILPSSKVFHHLWYIIILNNFDVISLYISGYLPCAMQKRSNNMKMIFCC